MKTCGEFSCRRYEIELPSTRDSFKLIPFGDVHRDADSHDLGAWRRWLEYARKEKNAFFLGMGDYLDGYSCSERAILSCDGIHETSRRRMERQSEDWVRTMANELKPISSRLIGLIGGNHYPVFADGTNGDQRLARMLDVPFLGVAAALRIVANQTSVKFSLDVFAHHGRGSARTVGGGLSGTQKLTDVCDADIYLMGDDHKAACAPLGQRLRIESKPGGKASVVSRTPWVARTGSFTRGYQEGISSYVVDAALPPTTLGWVEFTARIVSSGTGAAARRRLSVDGATRML